MADPATEYRENVSETTVPHDEASESTQLALIDAPQRRTVHEADTDGAALAGTKGRLNVRLIRAGWSLNDNYYPASVLRRDAAKAWPKGTKCYADHATDEEEAARPAGSVRNLAAVLTTDARWDEQEQAVVAEARVYRHWWPQIEDMHEDIGMSIRAWVTGEHGEVDGRDGFVIQSIPEGRSVDFVTVPAAGGGIVSVLEAVGNVVPRTPAEEARNAGHWLEARIHSRFTDIADHLFGDGHLTREERITLSGAVGAALEAFAARVQADAPQLYERDPYDEPQQAMPAATAESTTPEVEPAPIAPAESTTDVTDGAPPTAPDPSSKEDPDMSGTETGAPPVEAGTAPVVDTPVTPTAAPTQEAARPDAGTVAALEAVTAQLAQMQASFTALSARADQRDAENRALRNRGQATEAVTAALRAPEYVDVAPQIGHRVTARVLAAIPTTGDGSVDEAALTEAITAAVTDEASYVRGLRAEALESAGVGAPYGVGSTRTEPVNDGFEDELNDFFGGTLGMSESAASIASKGRG